MFYPLFALVVLTYSVFLLNLYWRVQAVRQKRVSIKYFRTYEDGDAPTYLKTGSRHYSNLFEMPVLFYCAGLAAMALDLVSSLLILLAWVFVGCRVVHAAIHMSYNHIGHRALAFWCGSTVVLAMWVTLLTSYIGSAA